MIELTELRKIERAAITLLKPLASARPVEILSALKPHEEDYERVFKAEAVVQARDGYEQWWTAPPRALGKRNQTEVLAFATTADVFSSDNEFSSEFPGAYRQIAKYLRPELVWIRFKFVEQGSSSGMAYDGLVRLDDRFAWFPKPWRILAGEQLDN